MKDNNLKLFKPNFSLLIKLFFSGVLFAEIILVFKLFGERFELLSNSNINYCLKISSRNWTWIIILSYTIILITYLHTKIYIKKIINIYLYRKKCIKKIVIILRKFRIDLLSIVILGSFLSYVFNGFCYKFLKNNIYKLKWEQMLFLLLIPFFISISFLIRKYQLKKEIIEDKTSLFVADKEIEDENEDRFNFTEKAERFAERVFNNGSNESLVFGIEAPWGAGKSSFVNLCKKYLTKNYKNKIIVYEFNPLRYENQDKLLEKFIGGLIMEIKQHIFVPEINSLISKYSTLLRNIKTSFSFFGFNISFPLNTDSIDNIIDRLETALKNIEKKIIIIVDDLDRLNYSSIKEVLFVIKKSFTFPNISYVLCYDIDNISKPKTKNLIAEDIFEFFEKFINIKISLFIDSKLLLEYFTENKELSLANNIFADPKLYSKTVEGLKDIFKSDEYHLYLPFIGDARKLKRLVNIISLLEIDKTDYDNSDFNKHDLIHLLLIYINYPNIFRKIYNTETNEKNGYFSLIYKSGDDSKYDNSIKYTTYEKDVLNGNQKFILNKVFKVSERLKTSYDKPLKHYQITEEIMKSYACFNGTVSSLDRNLENYLNLIVNMAHPPKFDQYNFYKNIKSRVLNKEQIQEVLNESDFDFSKSEKPHAMLWKVLVNTKSNEFTLIKSSEILNYALNSLPKYSILEISEIEIGFRNTLIYYIIKLLDKVGWTDQENKHSNNNTDENVIKLAYWIFGSGTFKDGILDILSQEDRGVIGLFDLMLFRLNCCADRGGDIFNIVRAILKHANPNATTKGDTNQLLIEEMREISQKVFQIFKAQYIDKKKNIFDEIDSLSLKDVCGEYYNYVDERIKSKNISNINSYILIFKAKIKVFIMYQLGNTIIENGIGCGYYNIDSKETEKDKGKISAAINDYLFNFCFNPEEDEKNYEHFLDILLMNFSSILKNNSDRYEYIPKINQFTKVLNKKKLIEYWVGHKEKILSNKYEEIEKTLYTVNYSVTYKENLPQTYKVLDELVELVQK